MSKILNVEKEMDNINTMLDEASRLMRKAQKEPDAQVAVGIQRKAISLQQQAVDLQDMLIAQMKN